MINDAPASRAASRDARAIREPARVDDAAPALVGEHGAAELDDGDARHARSVATTRPERAGHRDADDARARDADAASGRRRRARGVDARGDAGAPARRRATTAAPARSSAATRSTARRGRARRAASRRAASSARTRRQARAEFYIEDVPERIARERGGRAREAVAEVAHVGAEREGGGKVRE